ncbi:ATP-binding protein [Flavobacterium sp.]|jgi:predicted AAA+ superfamily ATPase|uniref:ATP-binding protein n=1 Tax=Flavobacterium sp. TaxID=239 RepID=UPI0037BEFAC2
MIQREAKIKLEQLAKTFKAIAVIGPRQSGKTTLVKSTFPDKPYISLENPDTRQYALEDPRGFLENISNGAILDEVRRTPELFSYLQELLDNSTEKGLFILTGSNNFLLQENISQSLAGRVAYLNLLPFSVSELKAANLVPEKDEELLFNGFYPPIYDQKISPMDWIPNYIKTYIERDVRQIKNVTDLLIFEKFMRVLAGRTGQELNFSAISNEVGIDLKTIQSWIGILESSFIIYLLKPHFQNFNKTIVKRPKIYFYDTGLVCSFLRISNPIQLESHPLKGSIFETMVVVEMVKKFANKGLPINIYFWRDKTGHEVDVIIDNAGKLIPIEIKSSKTISTDFFKNLKYWNKLSSHSLKTHFLSF